VRLSVVGETGARQGRWHLDLLGSTKGVFCSYIWTRLHRKGVQVNGKICQEKRPLQGNLDESCE